CEFSSLKNPTCLGYVYGIVGKVKIHPELDKKLILIRQQCQVGTLTGCHRVYNINKIVVLPLTCFVNADALDLGLDPCKKHHNANKKSDPRSPCRSPEQPHNKAFQKTWNSIKTATAQATTQVKHRKKEVRDKEKFEKRITEELLKMFTDTNSFYYSTSGDITNSLQRQYFQSQTSKVDLPLWQRVDERFFWNRYMLLDLIESKNRLADHWIIPVIQGFVQIETCSLDFDQKTSQELMWNIEKHPCEYKIILISRRSRDRAGTRYKRRGVDESGKCANYVETEQIIEYVHHCLSFIQVRGSVPVFWSQPGYKYRPPPHLDKGEEETQVAFEKHFAEELSIYNHQILINLVEQVGKERVLADAYLNHVLNYNSPNLTYVSRGMRFGNVSILISNIEDIIKEMWYCWIDKEGLICQQKGTFRVNCIDCLDRTNVVQTALAKAVLEIQLGLLPPEGILPPRCRNIFQIMWANNGDIISRQYAGTAALKGDFTRTGERRFAGMMKDGYNSANRYYLNAFKDGYRQACFDILQGKTPNYDDMIILGEQIIVPLSSLLPDQAPTYYNDLALAPEINLLSALFAFSRYYMNRFKDAYRQATIDLMLGNNISDDILGLSPDRESPPEDDAAWLNCQAEHVKQLIDDCKRMLVPNAEIILGGWALIDADPVSGDPAQVDMDSILILTKDSYYVAEYDDESDRITRYQRVMLNEIEKIELGPEPSIFKSKFMCVRINYQLNFQRGYFHMFRSANTRFFNNMAVPIKTEEEAIESLKAIVETIAATLEAFGLLVPVYQGKLERRKSKMPFQQTKRSPFGNVYLELPSFGGMPRNVSETQLLALRNVGTKAISNMTSQIAKLNPMKLKLKKNKNNAKTAEARVTVQVPDQSNLKKPDFVMESSSDEEAEEELQDPTESNQDLVLSSCGILATGSSNSSPSALYIEEPFNSIELGSTSSGRTEIFSVKKATDGCETQTSTSLTASTPSPRPQTPEITVSRDESESRLSEISGESSQVVGPKKLSHSSHELGTSSESAKIISDEKICQRRSSDQMQVPMSAMKTSHSEGALGQPPLIVAREFVVPGFSRVARGFQNLGANIGGFVRPPVTPTVPEDPIAAARMAEKREN
uniref:SAC domain-containing protein n=1 Tax=Strigamia maritima TaxID=126957 RepID=T1JHY8_STRMM